MSSVEISRGLCPRTHVMTLSIPSDVIEMGVSPEVFRAVFSSVHSTNRNSPDDDRLALDLPNFSPQMQGALRIGRSISIYGTEAALQRVLRDSRLKSEISSGKAICGPIRPVTTDDPAFSLVRVRTGEKSTRGGQERARRRVEKRGGVWEDRPHRGAGLNGGWRETSFVDLGDWRRVEFTRAEAVLPLEVSTYGLMSRG